MKILKLCKAPTNPPNLFIMCLVYKALKKHDYKQLNELVFIPTILLSNNQDDIGGAKVRDKSMLDRDIVGLKIFKVTSW